VDEENGEGESEDRSKSFEQLAKEAQNLIWGDYSVVTFKRLVEVLVGRMLEVRQQSYEPKLAGGAG